MDSTTLYAAAFKLPNPASLLRGLAALCLLLFAAAAFAAPPAAGTSIGNQASATYTDASLVSHSVTSNLVSTIVQQVASLTLTAPGTSTAAVGGTVYYPHTVTNTGNGPDTFNLSAAIGGGVSTFTFTTGSILIYLDNGSGQPTGPAITSTTPLPANGVFKFVVAGTVPNTATSGQVNYLTVSATSTFNTALAAQTNVDQTTLTNNAVITLDKQISVASGAPGSGPYTYTLTYRNTGNNTATAVTISDLVPAGLTYVSGSGQWSGTGSTLFADAKTTYPAIGSPNITYDYNVTTAGKVTATINTVGLSTSGTLTFQVRVAAGTAAGSQPNTAKISYNDGSATLINGSSNTADFTVTKVASVSISGATVATANPGTTVSFTNLITNNGNSTDIFNISLSGSNYPAGTSFLLYKGDGTTPLVDTNGDNIPDTGPMLPGATYNVVVKALLPANASGSAFTVNKTATSTVNNAVFATAADNLTTISPAKVDVTNSTLLGVGPGPEAGAVLTNTTNPGTTTIIPVIVNNTGPTPDTYNLDTGALALPAGWSVTFKLDTSGGSCTTTGATLTNTGTVNAGAKIGTCAVISVPAGFAAGTQQLNFRALSPGSGATDTIHDAVTVNAVRSLGFTTNNTGQVSPGGSFVYSHTLTNTGNVLEGNGTVSTITLPAGNSQTGWTSVFYYDLGSNSGAGNGTLDSGDPIITGGLQAIAQLAAGLAPGQSITLFDKVTAPSGVAVGVVNTTTMTATTANGTNGYVVGAPTAVPNTDTTTVIAGNVTLVKAQALDAACTGPTAGTVYTQSNLTAGAVPGACIDYQITVTNVGSSNATAVSVSDATPAFTTSLPTPASTPPTPGTTVGTVTGPATGTTGSVIATVGTLAPNATAVVTFVVKILQ